MSRLGVLFFVSATLLQWPTTMAVGDPGLTPPVGFSLSVTATTSKGMQMFICEEGVWINTGSSADLLDSTNTMIGTYKSVYDSKGNNPTMNWTLINSDGDRAESGDATSGVSGIPIHAQNDSKGAVPECMCEVTSHQGIGAASLVSYVVLTKTKGGVSPSSSCQKNGRATTVPFFGVFKFYTQDLDSPANIPHSIEPTGRLIEGLFVKGRIGYRYEGERWHLRNIHATIYSVAGGDVYGQYETMRRPDKYGGSLRWKFNDPNGFWLTGKVLKSVEVSDNGCPWQLMSITSSGGYSSPVGPYKYVQLTSTWGGQPPNNSSGATTKLLSNSVFSGIFWFITV